jgi:hypothetical protein
MRQHEWAELMRRPDIDQAVARYEQMYAQVRTQLTATFPRFSWYTTNPAIGASCNDTFAAVRDTTPPNDDIESMGLADWAADGGLSDPEWERALAVVRPIAHQYGFTTEVRTLDRPRDHQIDFYDSYGADFQLGSAVNTTLLLITDCHLTAAAKRRGTPPANRE